MRYTPEMARRDDNASDSALRALRAVRDLRIAELAALERAVDILDRNTNENADRCDCYSPNAPCAGTIVARFCRHCGELTRRCESHGGARAATHAADLHRSTHGGSDARPPAPDEPRAMPRRSASVPVGGVQVPPPPRGGSTQPTSRERRTPNHAAPQHAQSRASTNGATSGPGVIRRRGNLRGVAR